MYCVIRIQDIIHNSQDLKTINKENLFLVKGCITLQLQIHVPSR